MLILFPLLVNEGVYWYISVGHPGKPHLSEAVLAAAAAASTWCSARNSRSCMCSCWERLLPGRWAFIADSCSSAFSSWWKDASCCSCITDEQHKLSNHKTDARQWRGTAQVSIHKPQQEQSKVCNNHKLMCQFQQRPGWLAGMIARTQEKQVYLIDP